MSKSFIAVIVIGLAILAGAHAGAATVGNVLASPVPNPATFVNTSNQWLVNIWQWANDHLRGLANTNTNDPVIATIIKITSWFWHFTIDSFKQGWDSFLVLFKMATTSGSAAYNGVHWPWQ